MRICSICHAEVKEEMPAVLTVSGYGKPRYLCAACAERFDTVTLGREPQRIAEAMARISSDLAAVGAEDETTCEAVCEILDAARERAERITAGTYDFSEDESGAEDGELPEELLETEEDKALDRAEEEKNKRFDRILNWAWLVIGIGIIALIVYWIWFR